MSSARRSRIALPYSARFRRWMAGRPGFGFLMETSSSDRSSQVVNAAVRAGSGFGSGAGGI